MFQLDYKQGVIGAILGVGLFLLVSTSGLAGGWAVITLDELPAQVVAGQPLTVGFVVRQHGLRPMEGLTPQIKTVHTDTGESFMAAAKPEGEVGHYVASLNFPQPGNWDWSIEAFTMEQPMPALNVLKTAAVTAEPATPSPSWPLLVGVIGLLGAAGTWALWWRKRAWWSVVPVVGTLIVSGAGFSWVANSTEMTETKEVASVQVELGRNLFIAKGCIVCHHHRDLSEMRQGFSGFRVGPNLPSLMTMAAERELLHTWLKNPATIKPDTQMPNLNLKQTEIEALVTFLLHSASTGDASAKKF